MYINQLCHFSKIRVSILFQVGDNGVSNLVFGIGGPYGHSSEVRMRADEMVKLSDMVLNHQVRLVCCYLTAYKVCAITCMW